MYIMKNINTKTTYLKCYIRNITIKYATMFQLIPLFVKNLTRKIINLNVVVISCFTINKLQKLFFFKIIFEVCHLVLYLHTGNHGNVNAVEPDWAGNVVLINLYIGDQWNNQYYIVFLSFFNGEIYPPWYFLITRWIFKILKHVNFVLSSLQSFSSTYTLYLEYNRLGFKYDTIYQ